MGSRLSHARILPKKRLDNSSCCGYVVTNRGEGYFKFQHTLDFSTLTSMDQVYEAGWDVTTGWQVGSRNAITGQRALGDENALQIVPGEGMTMTVKGGQSGKSHATVEEANHSAKLSPLIGQQNASTFSAAEIKFPWTTLGGVFEIEAKVTRVIGTATAMFLYHGDSQLKEPLGWQDQQGIEMLGETLFKPSAKLPAGMSLVNSEPK
ncbi:hypothetical protein QFC22_006398 [Naganishia vaughanmartiniae]|uniref:Uncharacterized protein n=1 Tax=Naganishia vaughanmartiniae TaxID=1424756 RepID=A0ACC2WL13_9TREE|nr:hypothetical protein QFC22_006398 [Naganishia vaughanmartiniae]